MPTKKSSGTTTAPAKKARAAATPSSTFRGKVALADFGELKSLKQVSLAVSRLAARLQKMVDAGAKLEVIGPRSVAVITTADAKLARAFGFEPPKAAAKKAAAKKAAPAAATEKATAKPRAVTKAAKKAVAPAPESAAGLSQPSERATPA